MNVGSIDTIIGMIRKQNTRKAGTKRKHNQVVFFTSASEEKRYLDFMDYHLRVSIAGNGVYRIFIIKL